MSSQHQEEENNPLMSSVDIAEPTANETVQRGEGETEPVIEGGTSPIPVSEETEHVIDIEDDNIEAPQLLDENGRPVFTLESLTRSGSGLPRILTDQNQVPIWRRGTFLEAVWFLLSNILFIVALSVHSKKTFHHNPEFPDPERFSCESKSMRIQHWIVVQLCLQTAMLITTLTLRYKLPRNRTEVMTARRLRNIMSLYIIGRFSHLIWLVWSLLGLIWTFESKPCSQEIGLLYYAAFSVSIVHLVAFCVPVLLCCCSLPIGLLIYCLCPSWMNRGQQVKKASKREIKKMTTIVKYKPIDENNLTSMSPYTIKSEDANCAICLGDYEEGEELRFLRCKHHFHGECVMKWLQQNKTCPFCKKSIDGEDEKVQIKEVEHNTNNTQEVEVPIVLPSTTSQNNVPVPFIV